jgi:plasmid maintenance system antidote protein VapI
MTLQDSLRATLAAELDAAGLSRAEAARQLGVTAKHMSQMLTGKAPLSLAWADQIAAACGRELLVGSRPVSGELG